MKRIIDRDEGFFPCKGRMFQKCKSINVTPHIIEWNKNQPETRLLIINSKWRGAWVAQSVKRPTSSRSRSRGPWVRAPRQALSWWLGAWSLFPILCLPLSLCPSPVHTLSLSIPKINKNVEKKKKDRPQVLESWKSDFTSLVLGFNRT